MVEQNRKNETMPILKWAGGKRQLLSGIRPLIPSSFNNYYEPFLGGGALLFSLSPNEAVISDVNSDLINAYLVVKNSPKVLIEELCKMKNTAKDYYEIRRWDRDPSFLSLSPVKRAARLIYLNHTCYNGLYRVSSKGFFNTPYGFYKRVSFVNEKALYSDSTYLSEARIAIECMDFEDAVKSARDGDFVYFDPPYDSIENASSFTAYNRSGFGRLDQARLKVVCDELTRKGVRFLLSNSATDYIEDLYKDYHIRRIEAKRNINSVGTKRGGAKEVLVTNY